MHVCVQTGKQVDQGVAGQRMDFVRLSKVDLTLAGRLLASSKVRADEAE